MSALDTTFLRGLSSESQRRQMFDDIVLDETPSQDDISYLYFGKAMNMYGIEAILLKRIFSPFRVALMLIKLGYEPFPPTQFHSPLALLGWSRPTFVYPNIFRYTYRLTSSMGFVNIFTTGFFASTTFDFIEMIFQNALFRRTLIWTRQIDSSHWDTSIQSMVPFKRDETERILEESSFSQFIHRLSQVLLLKTWEVTISHPFYVIMTRQVAALIGEEAQYSWFHSVIAALYREEGVSGFFAGLVPRLIGELFAASSYYCLCRIVRHLLFGTKHRSAERMGVPRILISLLLCNSVYPFELTACIMSLHGTRLLGAAESNLFSNWWQCRNYLYLTDQISRGRSPFIRSHVQKKHLPVLNPNCIVQRNIPS